MNTIFNYLDEMRPIVARSDWSGLENTYYNLCEKLSSQELAKSIEEVDLSTYETNLHRGIQFALNQCSKNESACSIHFQYEMVGAWVGVYRLCRGYKEESTEEDEWVEDSVYEFQGPALSIFAKIYRENPFTRTPLAMGSTLYLIARTVAAFGRAANKTSHQDIPLTIGYQEQERVFRIS